MTDANPYAPPSAELRHEESAADRYALAATPRMRSIGRGFAWINLGFDYFRRSWAAWLGAMLLGMFIWVVVSVIPLVNVVFQLLTPLVWVAGIALGCRAQSEGQAFRISHLWAGFRHRASSLMLLSLFYNVLIIAIGLVSILAFSPLTLGGDTVILFDEVAGVSPAQVLLTVLVALALTLPIVMATLFAPHLIVFHQMSILQSIRTSFVGCLKNVLPFLAWGFGFLVLFLAISIVTGLAASLLGMLAIPLMLLGFLILVPLTFASIYVAYEDIFLEHS